MPWGFEGIQAIRPAVPVSQLPMMDGLGEGRTLADRGTGGYERSTNTEVLTRLTSPSEKCRKFDTNLRCNFRDELQAARPLTDESQSLDRSHWSTCSIASSTSGTRPAPKVKLCWPSETECTIICLAYSRTEVS